MKTIYEQIKQMRIKNNLTQQELAERLGYKGKSMVCHIEKGEVDLPLSIFLKIADIFGCEPSDLLTSCAGCANRDSYICIVCEDDEFRMTADEKAYSDKMCDMMCGKFE